MPPFTLLVDLPIWQVVIIVVVAVVVLLVLSLWVLRQRKAEEAAAEVRTLTFQIYRDIAHEWRWRLVHKNGNILADSGEGYKRQAACMTSLQSFLRHVFRMDYDIIVLDHKKGIVDA